MKCKPLFLPLLFSCVLLSCASENQSDKTIAIVHATIIDLDNYGTSSDDLHNTVVLIRDGKILKIGIEKDVEIPNGSRIIDASDKFLVPGLIDGFGTLNDQNYADAFLYMGVTSIVGLESPRRGKLYRNADPSPRIYDLQSIYGTHWDYEADTLKGWKTIHELEAEIDSLAQTSTKVLLVYYDVKPEQLGIISMASKKHNIATIGELGHSTYEEAIDADIDAFVHTSRYAIDIIPDSIRKRYKTQPFGKPRIQAYDYYENFNPLVDEKLMAHSTALSQGNLMPTWGLFYPSFDYARNPWSFPIAQVIHEDSLHMPLDKESGKWNILRNNQTWDTLVWSRKLVNNLFKMEQTHVANGAHYLTGSGTDAFGTIPGVSLHLELEMLVKSGLSNRQALSAATTNFSKIFRWNEIGQIKEGAHADILILDRNPIVDLKNLDAIDYVVIDGIMIKRSSLLDSD